MPCKTCNTADGLQVCLFCGHAFCGAHRGDRDGAIACTPCLEAEHVKRSARNRVATAAASKTSDRTAPGNGAGDWMHVGPAAPPPPQPIPEPAFWTPILAGASAAIVTGAYLWFFLAWLLTGAEPAPAWAQPTGTAAGAGAVFLALWIIVKSRMS